MKKTGWISLVSPWAWTILSSSRASRQDQFSEANSRALREAARERREGGVQREEAVLEAM